MKLPAFKMPDMTELTARAKSLTQREKIMIGATGGIVLLAGLWFLLFAGDSRTTDDLEKAKDKLAGQLQEQRSVLNTAKTDLKRQTDWQHRSLPANRFVAESAYQKWLLDLAGRARLHAPKISATETSSRREQFEKFSFTLKATASISNLVEFMHGFYNVGYLHQIRIFDVKKLQQSQDLDVTITIEVLSLPGAEAKDKLPTEPGHGLQLKSLADYSTPITKRNLFSPYLPARIPFDPPPIVKKEDPNKLVPPIPTIDPATRAFVTGFTEVDGVPQIWLMDRLAGKSLTLQVGETFRVGKASGVVRSIAPEGETVIEYDHKKLLLHGGDSLRDGVEVKDVGKSSATFTKVGATKADRGN